MPDNDKEKQKKPAEWKPGMECVPGNSKEEDGKVYVCTNKGKWRLFEKEKTIEGGIRRIFDLPPKDRKTFLTG